MTIKEGFFYTIGKCVWRLLPSIARYAIAWAKRDRDDGDNTGSEDDGNT